jgi:isopentenyl phosphate kinase
MRESALRVAVSDDVTGGMKERKREMIKNVRKEEAIRRITCECAVS